MTGTVPDVAVSSSGALRELSELGVLAWSDVHAAQQWAWLYGETDDRVRVALALAVRALRGGSVCLDLAATRAEGFIDDDGTEIAPGSVLPELTEWVAALEASPCVRVGTGAGEPRPARWVDGLLYLERYWHDQETVRTVITTLASDPITLHEDAARQALASGWDANPAAADQNSAVERSLTQRLSIVAGGPGTGKTTVLNRLIDAIRDVDGDHLIVGLAAPTGKAAARMTASLSDPTLSASTLHRLLGWLPGRGSRFAHNAANPLPHDLVIVDEVSMVSMMTMSRLVEALKPGARLVLVGDPDQLASVEAGSVLTDLTQAPALAENVSRLTHNFRFAGDIARLADAIRDDDPDAAIAALGGEHVRLLPLDAAEPLMRERTVRAGTRLLQAALAGDADAAVAALDRHRLLCGHRTGPLGVGHWTRTVERWLSGDVEGFNATEEFHVGRPVMVSRNTGDLDLYNGDTGVIVSSGAGLTAAFPRGNGHRTLSPYVLDGLQTVHAMTIHKSQGSQFDAVTVILPAPGSPLLTRELLYTAVTRAENDVLLIGTEEAVREAVSRRSRRTSGLASRLG